MQIHTRLDNLEIELRAKYVACQRHIYGEMIFLSEPVNNHLRLIFDLGGELPNARAELVKVVDKMIKGYAQMLVELPSVTLVASLFTQLEGLYTTFKADYDNVSAEHKESRLATVRDFRPRSESHSVEQIACCRWRPRRIAG